MNTEKAAKRFAKSFSNEITFTELKKYVEKRVHYKLLFTDTEVGERELDRLNLKIPRTEKSLVVNSGTSRIIFIKSNLSEDDKIQCLLHECGHIVLGHVDMPCREFDREKAQREAERFSYIVLSSIKRHSDTAHKIPLYILIAVVCIESAILIFNYKSNSSADESQNLPQEALAINASSDVFSDTANDIVHEDIGNTYYVTAHGNKYHKPDCRYVEGKTDVNILTKEEAMKKYSPCLVCEP